MSFIALTLIGIIAIVVWGIIEQIFLKIYNYWKWVPVTLLQAYFDRRDEEHQVQLMSLMPLSKWTALCFVRVAKGKSIRRKDEL
jgi:hypothetical protein